MHLLENNVTIITGGGRGIGFGVATAFARQGSNLVLCGRTESTLLSAKEELEREYGVQVLCITADGSDEQAATRVVQAAADHFGKIDTVVNNAQISRSGVLLVDHSREDFDMAIMSGLYATFFYMKASFPYLKQTRGSVINFASGAGLFGKPGQASYAAAKEGIRGMTRVAATEWGAYGVRANVVCPLAMTSSLEKWRDEYPELFEKTIKDIPLQRFGDPSNDIGNVCVFLASELAAYVSGETVTCQGGSGLRP